MKKTNSNFWIFLIFSGLLVLQLFSNFANSEHPLFHIGLVLRFSQLALAFGFAIWNYGQKRQYSLSTFMLISMYIQIVASYAVQPDRLDAYNYIPVFFVISALGFDGNMKKWWSIFVPLSLPPFIVPLTFKSPQLYSSIGSIADNFMMPIFAVCASIGFVQLILERNYYRSSLEQLNKSQAETIEKQSKVIGETIAKARLADIARQVAHDIRSPLSALNTVASLAQGMTDQQKELVKQATARINDISEDLLSRSRDLKSALTSKTQTKLPPSTSSTFEIININSSIHELIMEKKYAYHEKGGVQLTFNNRLFQRRYALGKEADFRRALSNILNNAFEAIEGHGTVSVSALDRDGYTLIEISDNGRGIPAYVLPQLFHKGATFSKESGNGLGLSFAKEVMDSIGAHLTIASTLHKGTKVSISLPHQSDSNSTAATS